MNKYNYLTEHSQLFCLIRIIHTLFTKIKGSKKFRNFQQLVVKNSPTTMKKK